MIESLFALLVAEQIVAATIDPFRGVCSTSNQFGRVRGLAFKSNLTRAAFQTGEELLDATCILKVCIHVASQTGNFMDAFKEAR